MRILFMGTPDFAVPCLRALLDAGHELCAVFTQPDKPRGRGYTLTPPPVKRLALEAALPVYQPQSLRTPEVLRQITALAPEVIVVVAYGKILPKALLEMPPQGCVNVHASLLPAWRGAAPIQWAVLHGDRVTGVTTMQMAEGLDTGDILLQAETPIGKEESAGELHDRLAALGAQLLLETLAQLPCLTPRPQGAPTTPYAAMLQPSMRPLDWRQPAQQLHDQIRGLNPWPVATTLYAGKPLKVYGSQVCGQVPEGGPGAVGEGFTVACGQGTALRLLCVQPAGKKPMDAAAFLRGHPLPPKAKLPF